MYRAVWSNASRLAECLPFLLTTAAFLGVGIGILSTLAGLSRTAMASPLLLMAASLALMVSLTVGGVWICARSMKRWSDNQVLATIVLLWIASRAAAILAFPHYVLGGDELYLRQFVLGFAAHGLTAADWNRFSALYDYPVWASRALPLYIPARILFGGFDLAAVRVIQILLGAGTLVFTFLIARLLAGSCCARVAVWLLTMFPYHLLGVLGYGPEIPGTFLFVAGVYLTVVVVRRGNQAGLVNHAGMGFAFGACLFLTGLQRGGTDLLLFTVALVSAALYRLASANGRPARNVAVFFAMAVMVWIPSRHATDQWISANDLHHLRSRDLALGFTARGWNLVTLGEYVPQYEALEIASPAADKQRVLAAVLVTEFARQPLALAVLPPAKIAKFFLLGYAAPAQAGLLTGGYSTSARAVKACTAVFALLMLLLCEVGLLRALRSDWLRRRLAIPLLLVAASVAAIVILGETNPRYSHPVHFALAILAAAGALELRKGFARCVAIRGVGRKFVAAAGILAGAWLLLGCVVFGVATHAPSMTFADLRACRAEMGGAVLKIEPLHPWTGAWEGVVEIPAGTLLPVELRFRVPAPERSKNGRKAISLWLPDQSADPCPSCEVVVRGAAEAQSLRVLARMKRFYAGTTPGGGEDRMIEIAIDAHVLRTSMPIRLALGYILPD